MKTVAVVCLSKNNGGMELAAIKIALLLRSVANVYIIARKDSFIEQKAVEQNIETKYVLFQKNFSFSLIKQVRNILKKDNINNIIFLGASELKSLYFSFLGLDINLIIRQGTYKNSSKKDFFHKLIYSNVAYFIANSNYIMESVKKVIPLAKNTQLKIIYASFNASNKIAKKESNDIIKIINIGRITEGKAQLDAIKSCEYLALKQSNFQIDFYGDIEDQNYYEFIKEYLKSSTIKDKVFFHNFVDDITTKIKESDIMLFPSLGEGFSNAVIETLSYGVVTIVYDNSSMPELFNLGMHISLVESQNQDKLNDKLVEIVNNLELEQNKSNKNIELSHKLFNTTREMNEYFSLLK
ncbi:MAG: glycosyltransferase [Helicobacteraceae bacterium]|nr:glycosyltransferase [Helicobacteraceae bacterium]